LADPKRSEELGFRSSLILRRLSEGASGDELLEAYPRLTREDIQAAMRYAADALAHEEVLFIGRNTVRSSKG
jgi:uncharacterized protein (DUF433 family)